MAETKFEKAKQAVNDLFSDTSVDADTTRRRLQELKDEIDIMLDSL